MQRPRAFVELCAGSGILSLTLAQGMSARAPVPVMGSKLGYRAPILAALGLFPGQGSEFYVLSDASPWGLVWAALCMDAAAVADRIAAWEVCPAGHAAGYTGECADCMRDEDGASVGRYDPRTLWTKLRTEWKEAEARGELPGAGLEDAAARWLVMGSYAQVRGHPFVGGFDYTKRNGKPRTSSSGAEKPTTPTMIASRTRAATFPPGLSEWAARWLVMGYWSYRDGHPESGFNSTHAYPRRNDVIQRSDGTVQVYTWAADTPTKLAHRTRAASLPSAIGLQMDASELVRALPEDLAGVVVYIDPPYQDTTGYAHKYPREAVLADAEDLHRRGAVVAISEAVPLADDLGAGWHAVDMSHARTGQKRTNNTPEFLTMNRKPAHVPAKQQSLF